MDAELLSTTFVDLADTLVAEFDLIDFLHMLTDRSVTLLAASATTGDSARRRGGSSTTVTAISGGKDASLHHDEVKLYFWYAHYPRHP